MLLGFGVQQPPQPLLLSTRLRVPSPSPPWLCSLSLSFSSTSLALCCCSACPLASCGLCAFLLPRCPRLAASPRCVPYEPLAALERAARSQRRSASLPPASSALCPQAAVPCVPGQQCLVSPSSSVFAPGQQCLLVASSSGPSAAVASSPHHLVLEPRPLCHHLVSSLPGCWSMFVLLSPRHDKNSSDCRHG